MIQTGSEIAPGKIQLEATNCPVESECLLSLKSNGRLESRELRVRTNPILISDQQLLVMVFQDISYSKRHDVLERLFSHDVRNALEASKDGELIHVWFERHEGQPSFKVHNSSAMNESTARQVFKRSFSTKGEAGRGLGTFSMKLLGENFLKGEVSFETGAASGTVFSIRLPIELALAQTESVN